MSLENPIVVNRNIHDFNLTIFVLYCVFVIMILFYLFIEFIFIVLSMIGLGESIFSLFYYWIFSLLFNLCIIGFAKKIKPLFVVLLTASFNYFIFQMCLIITDSSTTIKTIDDLLLNYLICTRISFISGNWLLPIMYLIWLAIDKSKKMTQERLCHQMNKTRQSQ